MKWLVAGDSHGARDNLLLAAERERPDGLLFTGDGLDDLKRACVAVARVRAVRGNCDLGSALADEMVDVLDGVRVLLSHGHRYRVKSGLELLLYGAMENEADLVIFGHTHEQTVTVLGGVTFLNPGAIKNGEYAVVDISPGRAPDIRPKRL